MNREEDIWAELYDFHIISKLKCVAEKLYNDGEIDEGSYTIFSERINSKKCIKLWGVDG